MLSTNNFKTEERLRHEWRLLNEPPFGTVTYFGTIHRAGQQRTQSPYEHGMPCPYYAQNELN